MEIDEIRSKHIIISNLDTIKLYNEIKYFYISKGLKYSDEKLIDMLLECKKCQLKKEKQI